MTFSKTAQAAIDRILYSDAHVFVTGKAGTGKSTLLEHIRLHTTKKTVVVAPTGISAINVHGDTIHSFFGLKPGYEKDEAQEMRIDEKKEKKFKRLRTLMIDEISMVRADLFDAMDIVLRRTRKDNRPFGGVQLVLFGDLYQLPPVVTPHDRDKFLSEYASPYFFDATVFRGQGSLFADEFKLNIFELDEIYRQHDDTFINILNGVRDKTITEEQFLTLNARYNPQFLPREKDKYIYLVTTNAQAAAINDAELKKLPNIAITFCATQTGDVPKNLYPNDEEITVAIGAQIMFIYNDPERRWVNGTIGTIVDIHFSDTAGAKDSDAILFVEKADGETVQVSMYTWEISRYVFRNNEFVREEIGSYTQIPLRLAWAITIHKSQGKTFDHVIVDLGRGSFAHGQTYVALSRCTSLDGLVLKTRIGRHSIVMDERVKQFSAPLT